MTLHRMACQSCAAAEDSGRHLYRYKAKERQAANEQKSGNPLYPRVHTTWQADTAHHCDQLTYIFECAHDGHRAARRYTPQEQHVATFICYTSQERPVAIVKCPKPTYPSLAVLLLEKIGDLELFHDSLRGCPLGDGSRRGGRTGAPLGDGRSRGGRTSQGPPHQLVGPHQIVHVHDEAGWLVLHRVEIQLMAAHPVHLQQVAAEPLCSVKEAILWCIRHTSHKYSKVGCTSHGWTVGGWSRTIARISY
jgi:hypothetical protein